MRIARRTAAERDDRGSRTRGRAERRGPRRGDAASPARRPSDPQKRGGRASTPCRLASARADRAHRRVPPDPLRRALGQSTPTGLGRTPPSLSPFLSRCGPATCVDRWDRSCWRQKSPWSAARSRKRDETISKTEQTPEEGAIRGDAGRQPAAGRGGSPSPLPPPPPRDARDRAPSVAPQVGVRAAYSLSSRVAPPREPGTGRRARAPLGLPPPPPLAGPSRPVDPGGLQRASSLKTRKNSEPEDEMVSLCSPPFLAISCIAALERTANFWKVRLRGAQRGGRRPGEGRGRRAAAALGATGPRGARAGAGDAARRDGARRGALASSRGGVPTRASRSTVRKRRRRGVARRRRPRTSAEPRARTCSPGC